ncbi:MAG: hypothetical protein KJS92_00415 [Bacteroidetes bacterium]|nr:hypothetical protein [Bacteroidota bacterium]
MKYPGLLLLLLPVYSSAQQTLSVQPQWRGNLLETGRFYPGPQSGDSLRIDVLRFYLGVLPSGEAINHSYHLIDLAHPESMHIPLKPEMAQTPFTLLLGVDSMTQMDGAGGGALDPTQGMYWTWQSGYIHLKLEGILHKAEGRNIPFSYHIGGFEGKDNTLQRIPADQSGILKPRLDILFRKLDPALLPEVMSPGTKAVMISRAWKDCFSSEP